MPAKNPPIRLNNGLEIPTLGLGVYGTKGAETSQAVVAAIAGGYRLIDTAFIYANEAEVGRGITESGTDRSELFVQTKLWPTDFGYDQTLRAFEGSRSRLGLDMVDLYLLHWPSPGNFEASLASYQAMERLLAEGQVRAIGVSNFTREHLERLMSRSEVLPAVNQIELHPYLIQRELRETHRRLGIVTQSWSPLGGANDADSPDGHPLQDPTIAALATKYGKTPAQLILRWHIQHGLAVIPKSTRPERLAENMNVFDFELSEEDIQRIDALDTGIRRGPDPESFP